MTVIGSKSCPSLRKSWPGATMFCVMFDNNALGTGKGTFWALVTDKGSRLGKSRCEAM